MYLYTDKIQANTIVKGQRAGALVLVSMKYTWPVNSIVQRSMV